MADPNLDNLDVHDVGHRIVLAGEDPEQLRSVMRTLHDDGACQVQMPVRLGKRWVASFENPAVRRCTVEQFGDHILICGPDRDAVFTRSQHYRERGAQVVHGPVREGRVWRIYLEELDLFDGRGAALDLPDGNSPG